MIRGPWFKLTWRSRWLELLLVLALAACSGAEAERTAAPAALTPEASGAATQSVVLSSATPFQVMTATPPSSPTPLPPTPTAAPTDTPPPTPTMGAVTDFPDPAQYLWQPFTTGLSSPVGLANAGDGSGRLFVLEQAGLIRVIQDGQLLAEPFLDISGQVSCCGERGLLGIAFHPDYNENGFFYLNYTDPNGNTSISRFSVSEDPNRADPGSEVRLLGVVQPYPNHNGGMVAFGPDGYLYLGLGDGGSAGDPQDNAQNTGVLLGKILRIDVDGGDPYAIPADNPFLDGGAPEVWAYGLRNPWRFSFDRATGDLYIADVGQNMWEEIDFLPAGSPGGANFGWDYREGAHPYLADVESPPGLELIDPVAEYDHSLGCSVTGGPVYRGANLPDWQGLYLYGDYCSGLIWGLLRTPDGAWEDRLLFETGESISSFGEDEAGEVYLVSRSGTIFRLEEN